MEELSLCHNQLTGEIPVELARLSKLSRLMLNDNKLTRPPLNSDSKHPRRPNPSSTASILFDSKHD